MIGDVVMGSKGHFECLSEGSNPSPQTEVAESVF